MIGQELKYLSKILFYDKSLCSKNKFFQKKYESWDSNSNWVINKQFLKMFPSQRSLYRRKIHLIKYYSFKILHVPDYLWTLKDIFLLQLNPPIHHIENLKVEWKLVLHWDVICSRIIHETEKLIEPHCVTNPH